MADGTLRMGSGQKFDPSSPDIQAAISAEVQARVDAMLPELMARLAAAQAIAGTAPERDDERFVKSLSLQLAELTGQGTGRIYVAPEVIETRRTAFDRLKALVIDQKARRVAPKYRLTAKVELYLGPQLGAAIVDEWYRDNAKIVRATEVTYIGIPNMAMVPINESAQDVYDLFCQWTGNVPQKPDGDALPRSGVLIDDHGRMTRTVSSGKASRSELYPGIEDVPEEADDMPIAAITRVDDAPKRQVQVLGTLTRPVEVS